MTQQPTKMMLSSKVVRNIASLLTTVVRNIWLRFLQSVLLIFIFNYFLVHFCPLLQQVSFLQAAEAVAKIGLSLKLNHHKQIQLVQLGETQSTNESKYLSDIFGLTANNRHRFPFQNLAVNNNCNKTNIFYQFCYSKYDKQKQLEKICFQVFL